MDRFRISTSREANDGGGHPLTLAREHALYTSAYHGLIFETSEAEEAPLSPTGHPHVRTLKMQKADQNRRMQQQTSHQNVLICTKVHAHPSACIDFPVLMQKEKEASGCSNQAKAGHVASTDRVRKHPMISASCKPTKYTSGTRDRHSKVATAKGMRDRRVRLSPSCALNLFEIQDKLGFEQPSKAVEWLLQKAKHAIDKLPPKLITAPPNGANEQDTSSGNPTHSNMSSDHRSTSPLHELASPTSSSSHEKQTFHSLENFPPKTSDLSSSTELCHNLSLSLCPMVPNDLAPDISHVNGPHLRGIIPTPTRKDSRAKPGELRACKQNSSQLASPSRDNPHASTAISRVHVSLVL